MSNFAFVDDWKCLGLRHPAIATLASLADLSIAVDRSSLLIMAWKLRENGRKSGILIQCKGKIFANGENSEFRPYTKSKPNGHNLVNGQDFVLSLQILLIPPYGRQNSVKGENSGLASFCKFPAFSLKL